MSKDSIQTQPKKTRKEMCPNLRNKAFKFRIYPTEKQIGKLEWTLIPIRLQRDNSPTRDNEVRQPIWNLYHGTQGGIRRCKEIYNAALEKRREAYRMNGVSVSYYTQNKQLPEIKEDRPEFKDIHSQVLQDVLTRVDKAMDNFFRRVKNGEKPGYPRFKSADRYDSFTYTQSGFEIIKGKLNLSKIGRVKIKLHREIQGTIKTCTIKRESDQWSVVFTTEYERDPSPTYHPTTREIGVDLGINSFVALCTSKAEEAGCTVVKVEPHDTSQVCSSCGCVVKKDLSVRFGRDDSGHLLLSALWVGTGP